MTTVLLVFSNVQSAVWQRFRLSSGTSQSQLAISRQSDDSAACLPFSCLATPQKTPAIVQSARERLSVQANARIDAYRRATMPFVALQSGRQQRARS